MATETTAPKKPTRQQIEEFLRLEAERKELDRTSRSLERQADALRDVIVAYVEHAGGETRTVKCCDHVLALRDKPGYPAWKQEFIRVTSPQEAEAVIAAWPPRPSLVVEPLG